jgi:predicted ABC-class ATPase
VSTASTPVAEVVEREIGRLQLGAHRAVTDHHALRQNVEDVGVVAVFVSDNHPARIVDLCKTPGR